MFRLILFVSILVFLQFSFAQNIYAQVSESGTTEQPIIHGGKTTCTFRSQGISINNVDHVKTRESYISFTGSFGGIGFDLFEEEECEDVFSRVQLSAQLSNSGVRTLDDIETGKKYKGVTDYSFLGLRSIVEHDNDQVEIVSVSNYESEAKRGLEDVDVNEGEEPVAQSQAILRIERIENDNTASGVIKTASGVIKIRFKGTVGIATGRFVSGGEDEIRTLLRKANTKLQLENSELFNNGVIEATCSFQNVPINVFETGTPIDNDFDIRH